MAEEKKNHKAFLVGVGGGWCGVWVDMYYILSKPSKHKACFENDVYSHVLTALSLACELLYHKLHADQIKHGYCSPV